MRRTRPWRVAATAALAGVLLWGGTAASANTSLDNQHICLDTGQHLCMTALHPGLNSRVVLRPARHVDSEYLMYTGGQLMFINLHVCIGMNGRTTHCGTHGTGWQGITTPDVTWKYWNVQLTVHDPHKLAHWLVVPAQRSGEQVVVSTNWHLMHKWRECAAAHCTA